MKKIFALVTAALLSAAVFSPAARAETRVALASTTSTQNTGLFDVLLPAYYAWTTHKDVKIDVVAVGTGKAIEIAKRGDADILLVHDKEKEEKFVAEGWGVKRHEVMYNDFVVAGPSRDPAKVSAAKGAVEAFRLIAAKGAPFVSRGDESGTHAKEKKLWAGAGVDVKGLKGYYAVGQGMEETLRIADEKSAYTISDRATYNTSRPGLKDMAIAYQGDPVLFNQYSVIAVNPVKYPHVHHDIAQDFIEFITGPEGQKVIGAFKDGSGGALFVPNAAK